MGSDPPGAVPDPSSTKSEEEVDVQTYKMPAEPEPEVAEEKKGSREAAEAVAVAMKETQEKKETQPTLTEGAVKIKAVPNTTQIAAPSDEEDEVLVVERPFIDKDIKASTPQLTSTARKRSKHVTADVTNTTRRRGLFGNTDKAPAAARARTEIDESSSAPPLRMAGTKTTGLDPDNNSSGRRPEVAEKDPTASAIASETQPTEGAAAVPNSYKIKLSFEGKRQVLSIDPDMTVSELGIQATELLDLPNRIRLFIVEEGPLAFHPIEISTELVREVIPNLSLVQIKRVDDEDETDTYVFEEEGRDEGEEGEEQQQEESDENEPDKKKAKPNPPPKGEVVDLIGDSDSDSEDSDDDEIEVLQVNDSDSDDEIEVVQVKKPAKRG